MSTNNNMRDLWFSFDESQQFTNEIPSFKVLEFLFTIDYDCMFQTLDWV